MNEFRIAFCCLVCLAIGCSKPQPQKVAVAGVELTLPVGWKVASQKTSDDFLTQFNSVVEADDGQLHGAWELPPSKEGAGAFLALLSSPMNEEWTASYAKDPQATMQVFLKAMKEDGTFAVRANVGTRPAVRIEGKEMVEGTEVASIALNFIYQKKLMTLLFSTPAANINRVQSQAEQVISSLVIAPE